MARSVGSVLAVVAALSMTLLAGCASEPLAVNDLALASQEETPTPFGSVETTGCDALLACVERADAPLPKPVVRTSSSSGGSSAGAPAGYPGYNGVMYPTSREALLSILKNTSPPSPFAPTTP